MNFLPGNSGQFIAVLRTSDDFPSFLSQLSSSPFRSIFKDQYLKALKNIPNFLLVDVLVLFIFVGWSRDDLLPVSKLLFAALKQGALDMKLLRCCLW